MNHPVPLKPDDVSSHLTCAICLSIPSDPALTPCQHIFCVTCVAEHRVRCQTCPSCRSHNSSVPRLETGSLIYRVWSEIDVKCGNFERGCAWTGSIVDAKNHTTACAFADQTKKLLKEIEAMRQERGDLLKKYGSLQTSVNHLENQKIALEVQLTQAKQQVAVMDKEEIRLLMDLDAAQQDHDALRSQCDANDLLPKLFHGSYNFNWHDVIQLARLICRFYNNRPRTIDSNKIYGCIRTLYQELEANYSDSPVNYRLHMQLLLSACLTSNWFDNNQWNNINDWRSRQGWN